MDGKRSKFFGWYAGLSGLVYLITVITAGHDAEALLTLLLVAVGNSVLQVVFLLLAAPSRYLAPMPLWRLVTTSLQVVAVLGALVYAVMISLQDLGAEQVKSIGLPTALGADLVPLACLILWNRNQDRLLVLRRSVTCVMATAVLALLFTVSGHLYILSRDSNTFLRGLGTGIGWRISLLAIGWCIGPLVALRYYRAARRALKGQCLVCGYELVGLSEMRCPECGRAFTFREVNATAEELRFAGQAVPASIGRRGTDA